MSVERSVEAETVAIAERWLSLSYVKDQPSYRSKKSVLTVADQFRDRLVSICHLFCPGILPEELIFTDHYLDTRYFRRSDVSAGSASSRPVEFSLNTESRYEGRLFTGIQGVSDLGWYFDVPSTNGFLSSIWFSKEAFTSDTYWKRCLEVAARAIADDKDEVNVPMSEEERRERQQLAILLRKYPDVISTYVPKA